MAIMMKRSLAKLQKMMVPKKVVLFQVIPMTKNTMKITRMRKTTTKMSMTMKRRRKKTKILLMLTKKQTCFIVATKSSLDFTKHIL